MLNKDLYLISRNDRNRQKSSFTQPANPPVRRGQQSQGQLDTNRYDQVNSDSIQTTMGGNHAAFVSMEKTLVRHNNGAGSQGQYDNFMSQQLYGQTMSGTQVNTNALSTQASSIPTNAPGSFQKNLKKSVNGGPGTKGAKGVRKITSKIKTIQGLQNKGKASTRTDVTETKINN